MRAFDTFKLLSFFFGGEGGGWGVFLLWANKCSKPIIKTSATFMALLKWSFFAKINTPYEQMLTKTTADEHMALFFTVSITLAWNEAILLCIILTKNKQMLTYWPIASLYFVIHLFRFVSVLIPSLGFSNLPVCSLISFCIYCTKIETILVKFLITKFHMANFC